MTASDASPAHVHGRDALAFDGNATTMRTALARPVAMLRAAPVVKIGRIPYRLFRARLARVMPRPVTVAASLFWSETMRVVLPEPISTAIYCYGFFDEVVSWMLIDRIKPGGTVLDIGAHIGYFSRLAARLVGPTGQVHAFEPTPSTCRVLQRNVAHLPYVVANNYAVHECERTEVLTDYGLVFGAWNTLTTGRLGVWNTPGITPARIEVSCVSLDWYCASHGLQPSLIKIDAEGAEEFVIAGARETIARHRPLMVVEVGEERYWAGVERVLALDYDALFYDRDGRVHKSRRMREDIIANKDVLLVPSEVLKCTSSATAADLGAHT